MHRQARLFASVVLTLLALAPAAGEAAPAGADVAISADAGAPDGYAEYVARYPFRGSTFEWNQSLNVLGMVRSSELSWNPYYAWLLRFYPRYYLFRDLYVRLKVGLEIEWTNSDETTRYREPRFEDLWLDLAYTSLYREKWTGVELTPSLRLVLPTSLQARAASLYLGIGPGFSLRRSFALPRGMSIELTYGFRYLKNLNRYPTAQNDAPSIPSCGGASGEGDCGQFMHTGYRNASHEFLNSTAVDFWPTSKLKVGLSVLFRNQLLYGLTPVTSKRPDGSTLTVADDPALDVSSRAFIWYVLEAVYQVHPLLGVGLSVSTLNPQLGPDGKYYEPFVNRYTEVGLALEVALDKIVAGIERRVRPRPATGKR